MKFFLVLLAFYFSIFNTVGQEKEEFYKEVDEKEVREHYLKYSIEVPENWFSYKTDPGLMAHSPNQYKDSIHPHTNVASVIIRTNLYKRKSLEKSLKFFLRSKKKQYGNFNYKLIDVEHKLYGKFYMIRYFELKNKETTINLTSIINWEGTTYCLFYSSRKFNYDKYVLDVLKMINSFKIKE